MCIQKRILLEEPFLQCHAASLAFLFHLRNLLSQLHIGLFRLTYALLPHSLQPLELGFQELAFTNQFRFHASQFFCRKCRTQMITVQAGLLHLFLGLFQGQTGLFMFLWNGYASLMLLDTSVQFRNAGLFRLEMTVRRHTIKHRRHKIIVTRRTVQSSGKRSQKTTLASSLNNQYPQHLALRQFCTPLRSRLQIRPHLVRRHHTKLMRSVTKRVGETSRRGNLAYGIWKGMEHHKYNTDSGPILNKRSTMLKSGIKPCRAEKT